MGVSPAGYGKFLADCSIRGIAMKMRPKLLDRLIGLGVTLFFLFITLTGNLDFTETIEMKVFDLRAKIAAHEDGHPEIELVVVTDDDLSELGALPWPRHFLAQGIQNLALAGAKTIALNILLTEPEQNSGLDAFKRLKEDYEMSGLAQQGEGLVFYQEFSRAMADLDGDAKLCRAIEEAGNVVLPVHFDANNVGSDQHVPDFIPKFSLKQIRGGDRKWALSSLVRCSRVEALLPAFSEVVGGIGHINLFPDKDGYVRSQSHVISYLKDIYFPSFPLAIVKLFKGLRDEDVSVVPGEGILLAASPSPGISVPFVDHSMRTLINWRRGPDLTFHRTPFTMILKSKTQTDLFRDKIVIVGATAPFMGDRFATPISKDLPGVEIVANSVANILNQDFLLRPPWIPFMELAALFIFGFFLTHSLPRLKAKTGAIISLGLLVCYGAFGTVLFVSFNIWLRVVPSMLLLMAGFILIVSRGLLIDKDKPDEDEKGLAVVEKRAPWSGQAEAARIAESPDEGGPPPGRGTTIGNYEVIGEIGRGATGVVYMGQDSETHRAVAIKTVRLSEFDEDTVDDIRDWFFRETETVRLLSHPNIAAIYDKGEERGLAYVAMEYLEGKNLEHYSGRDNLLPIRETLGIIGRVADALDYAHSNNVFHQDIKPANIIRIKTPDHIKVTDFRFAQAQYYMSPEQVSGKKIDGRSDIFSLGVVLFELLTGQRPFAGEDTTSLMLGIAREKHPSPRAINPKVPRVVEKIIDKALEKDLEKRYQSAGQMAAHLKKLVVRIDETLERKRAGL
ncbi:MAG: serine/threonine-protein kinase [Thermodesulfobacteriota bacterium]|nr:serine/threonine-protein kinase [Thermodesulfobacteriota bacterium]